MSFQKPREGASMYTLVIISTVMNLNPGNMQPGQTGPSSMIQVGQYESQANCTKAGDAAVKGLVNVAGVPVRLQYTCVPLK
jgi:hypothetical protein